MMKKLFTRYRKIFFSGFLYLVIVGIFVASYLWDISLSYIEWWILMPGILICKDIYLFGGNIEPMTEYITDREKVNHAFDHKKVPKRYKLALMNRKYIFPVLITIYLAYLIVGQTKLRDLHISIRHLALDEQLLLFLTMVSGVLMMFGEEYDEKFEKTKISIVKAWGHIILSVVLSVLGGYIVLGQVLELGLIGMFIGNIVVVLIFLAGVVLLRERKCIKNMFDSRREIKN